MPRKKHKKHTPIMSKAQLGAMGSAYGSKKAGKGKNPKTPAAIWQMPLEELKRHIKEAKGKNLPKKVRRKKRKQRK